MAVESLLAEGEEYVVTLEDESALEAAQEGVTLIVPEADVECEVANMS